MNVFFNFVDSNPFVKFDYNLLLLIFDQSPRGALCQCRQSSQTSLVIGQSVWYVYKGHCECRLDVLKVISFEVKSFDKNWKLINLRNTTFLSYCSWNSFVVFGVTASNLHRPFQIIWLAGSDWCPGYVQLPAQYNINDPTIQIKTHANHA